TYEPDVIDNRRKMRYCPYCAAEIRVRTRYCPYCGECIDFT
ncbi:MAG: zinc-ribbon domain-containing protein, partial [Candidatus Lokiarchaeota archaeon]|nr:zinc-ribbon domain-containing protein [Candidatus Lokiarchaeota archaeon]